MTCTRLTMHGMGIFQISNCQCDDCKERDKKSDEAYARMKAELDTHTYLRTKELTKNG